MDNTSRPAAFFDLDRTLIDTNSGILFAMEERRTRRISTLQFLTSLYWGALYHFNLIDIDRAYHKAVQLYKGQHTDDLERITRDWFESRVRHRIRPGAQKILAWHKSRGHPLILLTNSSCYLSENVSSAYELDGWLANTFPLDDHGRISGELEYPLCYGEGKLVRAREWAKDSGYCVEDSYFYTDSISDLPMLDAVAHPRIVNPDPRLARLAKSRNWEILDWKKSPHSR